MNPRFIVVSTGSELTAGRSQDTNSSWIANELFGLGYSVEKFVVLPDDPVLIRRELSEISVVSSTENPVLILMTGGLGPTEDDYTLEVVCELTGSTPVLNERAHDRLQALYRLRGRSFQEALATALRQVSIPSKSTVMNNSTGIAPGFWSELRPGAYLACMPGVPKEMTAMFHEELVPLIRTHFQSAKLYSDYLFIWGLSESLFQQEFIEKLDFFKAGKAIWGVAAKRGFIRVTYQSEDQELLSKLIALTKEKYGDLCTGDLFEELPALLIQKKLTVGTAESCTGGLAAKLFTDRAGSSEYFLGSIVSYANSIKENLLHVKKETLEAHGAVSEETAREMADNAASILNTDLSISITGIAGPGGATPTKRVGTVFIGTHIKGVGTEVKEYFFPFKRELFRDVVAATSLFALYNRLRKL
ncbi:nicotinamide-nucleotide amidohydrolase family protein [Leptospira langatensis]|uniref:CinA-like protein n=1 Tax=Leptospira langatensis TaxID=2484983 RepID=A0A5F1ZQZ4_9LEPT|nr:nicotinamide-nucleotide amidohydrolase family protein [Leptospira langatensis]TGK05360.1 nicotinamide-nucleotide amidohydrolase family protein [Leptospira langatensis]TGL38496.1 nicotinamide-nucleotide amidohydrolase family protein [Leptospira langatensis]